MSDLPEDKITEPDLAAAMSQREKDLRDQFIKEYMVDYDAYQAAIRIGYNKLYAKQYSVLFMEEPYVAQQIRLRETSVDTEESAAEMRKRIITGLIREANYRGPGCSQAARVAAFSKLATIHGCDAPTRIKTELTGPDGQPLASTTGMFVIPGLMTPEEWERVTAQQQSDLVDGTTAPVTPIPST